MAAKRWRRAEFGLGGAEQGSGAQRGWAAVTREGLATYAVSYLAVALFGAAAIPQLPQTETIWPAFGVYLAALISRDPKHWPALVMLTLFCLGAGLARAFGARKRTARD